MISSNNDILTRSRYRGRRYDVLRRATKCYDDSYPNLILMCSGPSLGPYLSRRLEHGIRHPSARRSLYNEVIRVRYGPPRVALKSSTRVLRHTEHSQRSIQTSLNSTQCPDWDSGCAFSTRRSNVTFLRTRPHWNEPTTKELPRVMGGPESEGIAHSPV